MCAMCFYTRESICWNAAPHPPPPAPSICVKLNWPPHSTTTSFSRAFVLSLFCNLFQQSIKNNLNLYFSWGHWENCKLVLGYLTWCFCVGIKCFVSQRCDMQQGHSKRCHVPFWRLLCAFLTSKCNRPNLIPGSTAWRNTHFQAKYSQIFAWQIFLLTGCSFPLFLMFFYFSHDVIPDGFGTV